ncbi:hypothetical protein [Burkholderia pseudomultivorans]|uniref:hypothetical protein n=1 Tax=Burkholderia pseudomultivorans TaxID=1207504 RepID=UPI0012D89DCB|nr:hypothetical protein [Burkholderia pseudomultivorans]
MLENGVFCQYVEYAYRNRFGDFTARKVSCVRTGGCGERFESMNHLDIARENRPHGTVSPSEREFRAGRRAIWPGPATGPAARCPVLRASCAMRRNGE